MDIIYNLIFFDQIYYYLPISVSIFFISLVENDVFLELALNYQLQLKQDGVNGSISVWERLPDHLNLVSVGVQNGAAERIKEQFISIFKPFFLELSHNTIASLDHVYHYQFFENFFDKLLKLDSTQTNGVLFSNNYELSVIQAEKKKEIYSQNKAVLSKYRASSGSVKNSVESSVNNFYWFRKNFFQSNYSIVAMRVKSIAQNFFFFSFLYYYFHFLIFQFIFKNFYFFDVVGLLLILFLFFLKLNPLGAIVLKKNSFFFFFKVQKIFLAIFVFVLFFFGLSEFFSFYFLLDQGFFLKIFILFLGFGIYLILSNYLMGRLYKMEILFLYWFLICSTLFLFCFNNLFILFLFLEIISFCLYGLLLLIKKTENVLTAFKYYFFSILASSFFLLSFFLLLVMFGSLNINLLSDFVSIRGVIKTLIPNLCLNPVELVVFNFCSTNALTVIFFENQYTSVVTLTNLLNLHNLLNSVPGLYIEEITLLAEKNKCSTYELFGKTVGEKFRKFNGNYLNLPILDNFKKQLFCSQVVEKRIQGEFKAFILSSVFADLNLLKNEYSVNELVKTWQMLEKTVILSLFAKIIFFTGKAAWTIVIQPEGGGVFDGVYFLYKYVLGLKSISLTFLNLTISLGDLLNPFSSLYRFANNFSQNFVEYRLYFSRRYMVSKLSKKKVFMLNNVVDLTYLLNLLNRTDQVLSRKGPDIYFTPELKIPKVACLNLVDTVLLAYLDTFAARINLDAGGAGAKPNLDLVQIKSIERLGGNLTGLQSNDLVLSLKTYEVTPLRKFPSALIMDSRYDLKYVSFLDTQNFDWDRNKIGGDTSIVYTTFNIETFLETFGSYHPYLTEHFEDGLIVALEGVLLGDRKENRLNLGLLQLFSTYLLTSDFLPFLSKVEVVNFRDLKFCQKHYSGLANFYLAYRGKGLYKLKTYQDLMVFTLKHFCTERFVDFKILPENLNHATFHYDLGWRYDRELRDVNRYLCFVYKYQLKQEYLNRAYTSYLSLNDFLYIFYNAPISGFIDSISKITQTFIKPFFKSPGFDFLKIRQLTRFCFSLYKKTGHGNLAEVVQRNFFDFYGNEYKSFIGGQYPFFFNYWFNVRLFSELYNLGEIINGPWFRVVGTYSLFPTRRALKKEITLDYVFAYLKHHGVGSYNTASATSFLTYFKPIVKTAWLRFNESASGNHFDEYFDLYGFAEGTSHIASGIELFRIAKNTDFPLLLTPSGLLGTNLVSRAYPSWFLFFTPYAVNINPQLQSILPAYNKIASPPFLRWLTDNSAPLRWARDKFCVNSNDTYRAYFNIPNIDDDSIMYNQEPYEWFGGDRFVFDGLEFYNGDAGFSTIFPNKFYQNFLFRSSITKNFISPATDLATIAAKNRRDPVIERALLDRHLKSMFKYKYLFARFPLFCATLYEYAVRDTVKSGNISQYIMDQIGDHTNYIRFRGTAKIKQDYITNFPRELKAFFFNSSTVFEQSKELENLGVSHMVSNLFLGSSAELRYLILFPKFWDLHNYQLVLSPVLTFKIQFFEVFLKLHYGQIFKNICFFENFFLFTLNLWWENWFYKKCQGRASYPTRFVLGFLYFFCISWVYQTFFYFLFFIPVNFSTINSGNLNLQLTALELKFLETIQKFIKISGEVPFAGGLNNFEQLVVLSPFSVLKLLWKLKILYEQSSNLFFLYYFLVLKIFILYFLYYRFEIPLFSLLFKKMQLIFSPVEKIQESILHNYAEFWKGYLFSSHTHNFFSITLKGCAGSHKEIGLLCSSTGKNAQRFLLSFKNFKDISKTFFLGSCSLNLFCIQKNLFECSLLMLVPETRYRFIKMFEKFYFYRCLKIFLNELEYLNFYNFVDYASYLNFSFFASPAFVSMKCNFFPMLWEISAEFEKSVQFLTTEISSLEGSRYTGVSGAFDFTPAVVDKQLLGFFIKTPYTASADRQISVNKQFYKNLCLFFFNTYLLCLNSEEYKKYFISLFEYCGFNLKEFSQRDLTQKLFPTNFSFVKRFLLPSGREIFITYDSRYPVEYDVAWFHSANFSDEDINFLQRGLNFEEKTFLKIFFTLFDNNLPAVLRQNKYIFIFGLLYEMKNFFYFLFLAEPFCLYFTTLVNSFFFYLTNLGCFYQFIKENSTVLLFNFFFYEFLVLNLTFFDHFLFYFKKMPLLTEQLLSTPGFCFLFSMYGFVCESRLFINTDVGLFLILFFKNQFFKDFYEYLNVFFFFELLVNYFRRALTVFFHLKTIRDISPLFLNNTDFIGSYLLSYRALYFWCSVCLFCIKTSVSIFGVTFFSSNSLIFYYTEASFSPRLLPFFFKYIKASDPKDDDGTAAANIVLFRLSALKILNFFCLKPVAETRLPFMKFPAESCVLHSFFSIARLHWFLMYVNTPEYFNKYPFAYIYALPRGAVCITHFRSEIFSQKVHMVMKDRIYHFMYDYHTEFTAKGSLFPVLATRHGTLYPGFPQYLYPGYRYFFFGQLAGYELSTEVGTRSCVPFSHKELCCLMANPSFNLFDERLYLIILQEYELQSFLYLYKNDFQGWLKDAKITELAENELFEGEQQNSDITGDGQFVPEFFELFLLQTLRDRGLDEESCFSDFSPAEAFGVIEEYLSTTCTVNHLIYLDMHSEGLRFVFYRFYDAYYKKKYFGNCYESHFFYTKWLATKIHWEKLERQFNPSFDFSRDVTNRLTKGFSYDYTFPSKHELLCKAYRRTLRVYRFLFFPFFEDVILVQCKFLAIALSQDNFITTFLRLPNNRKVFPFFSPNVVIGPYSKLRAPLCIWLFKLEDLNFVLCSILRVPELYEPFRSVQAFKGVSFYTTKNFLHVDWEKNHLGLAAIIRKKVGLENFQKFSKGSGQKKYCPQHELVTYLYERERAFQYFLSNLKHNYLRPTVNYNSAFCNSAERTPYWNDSLYPLKASYFYMYSFFRSKQPNFFCKSGLDHLYTKDYHYCSLKQLVFMKYWYTSNFSNCYMEIPVPLLPFSTQISKIFQPAMHMIINYQLFTDAEGAALDISRVWSKIDEAEIENLTSHLNEINNEKARVTQSAGFKSNKMPGEEEAVVFTSPTIGTKIDSVLGSQDVFTLNFLHVIQSLIPYLIIGDTFFAPWDTLPLLAYTNVLVNSIFFFPWDPSNLRKENAFDLNLTIKSKALHNKIIAEFTNQPVGHKRKFASYTFCSTLVLNWLRHYQAALDTPIFFLGAGKPYLDCYRLTPLDHYHTLPVLTYKLSPCKASLYFKVMYFSEQFAREEDKRFHCYFLFPKRDINRLKDIELSSSERLQDFLALKKYYYQIEFEFSSLNCLKKTFRSLLPHKTYSHIGFYRFSVFHFNNFYKTLDISRFFHLYISYCSPEFKFLGFFSFCRTYIEILNYHFFLPHVYGVFISNDPRDGFNALK